MPSGFTLFIDADDTLWENNVYFERVVDAYCELIHARGHAQDIARQTLFDIERVRTKTHGYGVRNFHACLQLACRQLLDPHPHDDELAVLGRLCAALMREPPLLLPDVPETLAELAGRHRIILFTKGDLDDQHSKLQRSGISRYFHQVDVVREKDASAYRDALGRHGAPARISWMVGNSPRSDIAPALECGLGAVFIPHPHTWELERGELPPAGGERFLRLERFADLVEHF